MKNKIFIFNFVEDILFFSPLLRNKLFFFKKIPAPPPPLNIKWSVPKGFLVIIIQKKNRRPANIIGYILPFNNLPLKHQKLVRSESTISTRVITVPSYCQILSDWYVEYFSQTQCYRMKPHVTYTSSEFD